MKTKFSVMIDGMTNILKRCVIIANPVMQPLNTDLFQNELSYLSMNINYTSTQYLIANITWQA